MRSTVSAGARRLVCIALCLLGFVAFLPRSADARQANRRIACTEAALRTAIFQAGVAGGGTITFSCRDETIPMKDGLGFVGSNVVIDGEDRHITLAYSGRLAGCSPGDNGVDASAAAYMRGHHSAIRRLTFRHFLESLQISGPNNSVTGNVFQAHLCSDDAVSTTTVRAVNTTISNNRFEGYQDKALQMSYGGGLIEGNTFINSQQPIRGPYDNTKGGVFTIRRNVMKTTGDRRACTGVTIDGAYRIVFEGNTLQCFRGLRLSGRTQALVRNNVIAGNPRQGVLIGGHAVVSLSGNTITNNGRSAGSEPAGGVVVAEGGRADLGGGTVTLGGQAVRSPGHNLITGNGVADVRNLRVNYTLAAKGNCWDHPTAALVATQDRRGLVTVNPVGSACGTNMQASLAPALEPGPAPTPAPAPAPVLAPGGASTPEPVACSVSPWSVWQPAAAWSACANGHRTRTEQRARAIVIAAQNGGAACPALQQLRTATQACSPGAEPPQSEACNDGIDNDSDGRVDENCSNAGSQRASAPRSLRRVVAGNSVLLDWRSPIAGSNPSGYVIDAGRASGTTDFTFPIGNVTSVKVPNVAPGKYYVRVRALSDTGSSAPSNEVAVTVGCQSAPSRPHDLQARTAGNQVSLTWVDDQGCNDTRFRVRVGSTPGATDLADVPVERTEFAATAPPGTYYVRVAAVSPLGESPASEEIAVTVGSNSCVLPRFATALEAQVSGHNVTARWSPTNEAAAAAADDVSPIAYVMEVGSVSGSANLGTFGVGRTTALTTATPPGTYYVRVRPANECGPGTSSNELALRVE